MIPTTQMAASGKCTLFSVRTHVKLIKSRLFSSGCAATLDDIAATTIFQERLVRCFGSESEGQKAQKKRARDHPRNVFLCE